MAKAFGETAARGVGALIGSPVASVTALKLIAAEDRPDSQIRLVTGKPSVGGGLWIFSLSSSLTGDYVLVAAPSAGSGRWLRAPGEVDLALPITFATADATALLTIQAGSRLCIRELFWEVTTSFTGGASSAIGVSSNKTTPTIWSTKGDLLGGATGDVLATLVSTAADGIVAGTVGTDWDTVAKRRGGIWVPTDTIRFDAITSAFTAGAGYVHVVGNLMQNAGA